MSGSIHRSSRFGCLPVTATVSPNVLRIQYSRFAPRPGKENCGPDAPPESLSCLEGTMHAFNCPSPEAHGDPHA